MANYTCVAENIAGKRTADPVSLTVYGKYSITHTLTDTLNLIVFPCVMRLREASSTNDKRQIFSSETQKKFTVQAIVPIDSKLSRQK